MKRHNVYRLNNGKTIQIKEKIQHYQSNLFDYVIKEAGKEYIISSAQLKRLMSHPRSTEEKLTLYMKYFAGRTDVYAQKWSNGKGYSPALKNWYSFFQARNDKDRQQKIRKEYAPYTKKVIFQQITSSDKYHHFGIYPLLQGDLTNLLVFDFDKHTSQIDPKDTTKAVVETCQKYDIDSLPEISSSGNSYHLWIFFSNPIKAKLARQLGKLLLIESMSSNDVVNLDCFDRMIPNQDKLPNKGFGNLIALPLKWSEVKQKQSIFTNKNLEPVDPSTLFDVLANTKRYSEKNVITFVNKILHDMGLDTNQVDPLSYLKLQKLPTHIKGMIKGQILIKLSNLTHSEQLSLLSLATFKNPEFTKRQRMRAPVWNIPSYLTAAKITRKYLCLPRGILNKLQTNCSCELEESFTNVSKMRVSFNGKLRKEQYAAVEHLRNHQLGIICAHTGFGKTVVGCNLIAQRKQRTLVIVPTSNIAKQWQQSAFKFLSIKDNPYKERTSTGRLVHKKKVEIVNGSRNHPSHLIDIVNIRKLAKMTEKEREIFYSFYGQIIVDECHHISAVTFEKVLIQANVRYIIGLTATPERSDGLQQFVYYRCGHIVYTSQSQDVSLIQRYLYPRYTNIGERKPIDSNLAYSKKISNLVEDNERNRQIVNDIVICLKGNRHILLLSNRIKHLKALKEMLTEKFDLNSIYMISGQDNSKLRIENEKKTICHSIH